METADIKKKRKRIIVRKGPESIVLKTEDIVFFYRDDLVVFAVDKDERKYMCDKSLSFFEEELDPAVFFRANRQYILNIDYIKSYRTVEKVKLAVSLAIPNDNYKINISQEMAPLFKKRMKEEL